MMKNEGLDCSSNLDGLTTGRANRVLSMGKVRPIAIEIQEARERNPHKPSVSQDFRSGRQEQKQNIYVTDQNDYVHDGFARQDRGRKHRIPKRGWLTDFQQTSSF